jgi:putative membrane protein insertion efficiency factor
VKQTSRTQQILRSVAANPVKAFFLGVIRLYQVVISPSIPGRCKYYPSCSQYALDAVREYGAFRGFVLGAWRVLRCNPLSYGGYDPVSGQKLFRRRPAEGRPCCDTASHSHFSPVCEPRHEVRA